MHYGQFIPTETGSITIEVTNNAEYKRQGQPILGQFTNTRFSETDVIQIYRMYNCPGGGVAGILRVYVRYGRELRNHDLFFPNDSDDPYVKVTAMDDSAKYGA